MPSTDPKPPAAGNPTTARELLRHALVSVGPSLGAYYGMRLCGVSEIQALIAATVVSGAQVLYKVVRTRTFDPVSGFLLFTFALSLAALLITNDPRMAQVTNTIPGIMLAMFFIGSAFIGRPLTELAVAKTRPGRVEQLMAEQHWTDGDVRSYHRMHLHVSFWFGAIGLVSSAISIAIIYSFSVDVAQGVNQIFSLVTTVGMIVGAIVVIRRYLNRRANTPARPGQSRAASPRT